MQTALQCGELKRGTLTRSGNRAQDDYTEIEMHEMMSPETRHLEIKARQTSVMQQTRMGLLMPNILNTVAALIMLHSS